MLETDIGSRTGTGSGQPGRESGGGADPWILDSRLFAFGEDGVDGFVSPYPLQELDALIDDLNRQIWAGWDDRFDGEARDAMRVARNDICLMTLYMCQVAFIRHRSAARRRRVRATQSSYAGLIRYLQSGELPEISRQSILMWPLSRASMVRWTVRMARSLVEGNGLWRLPRRLYRPDRQPLLTARTALLDAWCIESGLTCVVWEPNWYFEPVTVGEARAEAGQERDCARWISAWVRDALAPLGLPLQESEMDWLTREAATVMAAARMHLTRLRARSDLPKRLISASCGMHFDHMMRMAVTANGGEVIGGEHGCGLGFHAASMTFMNDIANCTTFVCRDETSASLTEAALAEARLPDLPLPPLQWPRKPSPTSDRVGDRPKGGGRTAIFVPLSVFGETAFNGPIASDVTAMDFNGRVLAALDRLDLKIVVKPHPASVGPGKEKYEATFGHRCSTQTFEQEVRDADVIVTAVPTSSTILSAIDSGLPIIVLNADVPGLSKAAKRFLSDRTTYIELTIGDDERIELPVAALERAVRKTIDPDASA